LVEVVFSDDSSGKETKREREKRKKAPCSAQICEESAIKVLWSEQKIKFQNVQKQPRLHFGSLCMCPLKKCCHSNAARGYSCNRVFRNQLGSISVLLSIIDRLFFGLQFRNKIGSLPVLLSIIDRLFFGLQIDKDRKNAPKIMENLIEKMRNREITAD